MIQQAEHGRELVSVGRGTVKGKTVPDGISISLTDVMLIPAMELNIISVRKLCSKGYLVTFKEDQCIVYHGQKELLKVKRRNGLYTLVVRKPNLTPKEKVMAVVENHNELKLWHERLGHLNEDAVRKMFPLEKFKVEKLNCISCVQGKMSRGKFGISDSKNQRKFGLIHSDICGPFEEIAIGGFKYFVTFIDDFSGFCFVYLIQQKSNAFSKFKELVELVKNKFSSTIGTLRSDNGGEYFSKPFETYLKANGILHQSSVPYTPQQNGVAERMNRTLQDSARTMRIGANLSKRYWGYAVKCAAFVRNMCPSASTRRKAPIELLEGIVPKLDELHVFGCVCYVHVPKEKRKKLDPKAIKCIFLGYSETSKGFIVQSTESARLFTSRDVKFFEDRFVSTQVEMIEKPKEVRFLDELVIHEIPARIVRNNAAVFQIPRVGEPVESESGNLCTIDSIDSIITESSLDSINEMSEDTGTSGTMDEVFVPTEYSDSEVSNTVPEDPNRTDTNQFDNQRDYRGSLFDLQPIDVLPRKDLNGPPEFSKRRSYYRRDDDVTTERLLMLMGEPETYREAVESPDSKKWMDAMKSELQSMKQNQTWDLVKLPKGRKVVDCKWVFKIKPGDQDRPPRYKARLCARGFSQVYGIDFDETYAPVVKFTSIRVFLAKAILMKMTIHQMDVVTAFLNAPLDEDIFMRQAPGFAETGKEHLVCKLKRSIYGLKQSPRQWNKVIDEFLRNEGFKVIDADCCIYMKNRDSKTIMVSLYVDDLMIASNCNTLCSNLKASLNKRFEMKDLGIVQVCLGLEFNWLPDGTCLLNQERYIGKVLERFNMETCKPIGCPIESGARLSKDMAPKTLEEIEAMGKIPYRSAVGSLIYLVTGTRPDIAVATSTVAKYCENPGPLHWKAVKRILRYLQGTSDWGILFDPKDDTLVGYSDADWAGDIDSRRSTTGYLFTIGGVPVSWKSKKQATVALSTAEAEYMALSAATQEVSWLRKFLANFNFSLSESTVIFEDNQGCIALAKNPVSHDRTKHIDIRYHFIREQIEAKTIDVRYLPTEDMLADLLTKGMTKERHLKLCGEMNLIGKRELIETKNEGGVLKSKDHSKLIISKLSLSGTRRSSESRSESSAMEVRRSKQESRMSEIDRELPGMTQTDEEENFTDQEENLNGNFIGHESKKQSDDLRGKRSRKV